MLYVIAINPKNHKRLAYAAQAVYTVNGDKLVIETATGVVSYRPEEGIQFDIQLTKPPGFDRLVAAGVHS